jgi:RimJ/RimL family protein N-acetyltransferase
MRLRPPDPALTDGVVLLRLLRDDDVEPMVDHCRDPEMQRWTLVPTPYGEADAREWIRLSQLRWKEGDAAMFAIADAGTGEYLGGIDVRSGPWPIGDVGYGVKREVRGQGLTPRALRLISRWAFDELGLVRVELTTDIANHASQRAAEKAGFVREGILRQRLEVKGHRSDCAMFSLIPADLVTATRASG